MDIKKFITSQKFEGGINEMITQEHIAIKQRLQVRNDNNNIDKSNSIHRYCECDFFTSNYTSDDFFNDSNIIEFEGMFRGDIDVRNIIAYSGPMIKRYFDPNFSFNHEHDDKKPIISYQPYYHVTLIDHSGKNIKDLIIPKYHNKIELINEKSSQRCVIKAGNATFNINKKSYQTISSYLLSQSHPLDRVALYSNDLWFSTIFIIEYYKKISCYDNTNVDPVFGCPEDLFNIYDRTPKNVDSLKYLIDIVDYDSLITVDKTKIENTFIVLSDFKYTVIEYLIIRLMDPGIHPIVLYQMKKTFIHLLNYNYFRPAFFVARLFNFDKRHPSLYEMLVDVYISAPKTSTRIMIDPNADMSFHDSNGIVRRIENLYHIDMYILIHLIKQDSEDLFFDYVARTGIIKKFKQESNTVEKIVNWIIDYKPSKIMPTLIDCNMLPEHHLYKIILLTENINMFGNDFLAKYLLKQNKTSKSSKLSKSSNTNPKISIIAKQSIPINQDTNHTDNDDVDNNDSNDNQTENQNDNDNGNENENENDIEIENENENDNDNMNENENDNDNQNNLNDQNSQDDCNSQNSLFQEDKMSIMENMEECVLEIDRQIMILSILPEIINRGLTRSFYAVLKMCPYILSDRFDISNIQFDNINGDSNNNSNNKTTNGNLLHLIKTDKAVDILEIILRKNIRLINTRNNDGYTPLILYGIYGLNRCIHKILDYGADYEITDNNGDTFLHKLCHAGYYEIIQHNIRRVISLIDSKNTMNKTPAIIAAEKLHEEIFYVLKGLNADLEISDIYGNTVYHYICLNKICPGMLIINKKNKYGLTPYDYCKIAPKYYHFQS